MRRLLEFIKSLKKPAPATEEEAVITPKREWIDEPGYCNCLWVTMARMNIPRIVLRMDEPLPNLDDLTVANHGAHRWIKAQEFNYEKLDRLTVIRMLAESMGLRPGSEKPWAERLCIDAIGDYGPLVERVGRVDLTFDGDILVLTVSSRVK